MSSLVMKDGYTKIISEFYYTSNIEHGEFIILRQDCPLDRQPMPESSFMHDDEAYL